MYYRLYVLNSIVLTPISIFILYNIIILFLTVCDTLQPVKALNAIQSFC